MPRGVHSIGPLMLSRSRPRPSVQSAPSQRAIRRTLVMSTLASLDSNASVSRLETVPDAIALMWSFFSSSSSGQVAV